MDECLPHRLGPRPGLRAVPGTRCSSVATLPPERCDVRCVDSRKTLSGRQHHFATNPGGWILMSKVVNLLARRAVIIHERLLEFYGEPIWRNPLPAIDELVSTILS